jgi:hypothetical protein
MMKREQALENLRIALHLVEMIPEGATITELEALRGIAPCVCGGLDPLAVIDGGMRDVVLQHAKEGPSDPYDQWEIGCRGRVGFRPVRVIILEEVT